MAGNFYVNATKQYFDTNGDPLSGGKINFYEAGTLTPLNVYSDQDLVTPLSNPVVLDGSGRSVAIWMQAASYKIILTDANDVTVQTVDNYNLSVSATFDAIKQSATTSYEGVVELATTAETVSGLDSTRATTSAGVLAAIAAQAGVAVGFMNGYLISNGTDADHDIDFAVGTAKSASGDYTITATSGYTKQLDADWAAGDAAGGMPATVTKTGTFTTSGTAVTGIGSAFLTEFAVGDILYSDDKTEGRRLTAIASDTAATIDVAFATDVVSADTVKKNALTNDATYHCHVLYNPTSSTYDYGFDTSATAVNLLLDTAVIASGFTEYRRVGSVITDGSGNIISFTAFQKSGGSVYFRYNAQVLDVSLSSFNYYAARQFSDVSVPRGIYIDAHFRGQLQDGGGDMIIFTSSDQTDFSTARSTAGSPSFLGQLGDSDFAGTLDLTSDFNIIINDAQIGIRNDQNNSVGTLLVQTLGYIDERI